MFPDCKGGEGYQLSSVSKLILGPSRTRRPVASGDISAPLLYLALPPGDSQSCFTELCKAQGSPGAVPCPPPVILIVLQGYTRFDKLFEEPMKCHVL